MASIGEQFSLLVLLLLSFWINIFLPVIYLSTFYTSYYPFFELFISINVFHGDGFFFSKLLEYIMFNVQSIYETWGGIANKFFLICLSRNFVR